MLLRNFKARVSLVVLATSYIGLSVLMHNPQFTSTLLYSTHDSKRHFKKYGRHI